MLAAMAQILAAAGLGTAGGIVGGLFGIGGGVLLIPLIGMLYGLDQQVAQGTALVMVVPNVLFAFWRYRRRVGVDLRIAATLGAVGDWSRPIRPRVSRPGSTRTICGSPSPAFWSCWRRSSPGARWRGGGEVPARPPLAWGWSAVLGMAGGVVSGLFGVGGAFIAPPVLTAFFGVRQIEAQGLALALVCPGTFVALGDLCRAPGEVDWGLGVPLAIGGIAAIPAGVAAALPPARAAPSAWRSVAC